MELGMMNQPIVYKLLATLRLSVDGHQDAACKIGKSGIIGRVVDWGANDSPPGIRAESTRLLAALFKHCRSKEVKMLLVNEFYICFLSSNIALNIFIYLNIDHFNIFRS